MCCLQTGRVERGRQVPHCTILEGGPCELRGLPRLCSTWCLVSLLQQWPVVCALEQGPHTLCITCLAGCLVLGSVLEVFGECAITSPDSPECHL